MKATDVILAQLKQARNTINFATSELSADEWNHRGEGATIQSIAAIYGHTSLTQDFLINQLVRGEDMIYTRDNWSVKTGVEKPEGGMPDGWSDTMKSADMTAFRDYHAAVATEIDAYIGSLADEDLDRMITFGPVGDMPLGIFLANVIGWHICHHAGEVAALSGMLGHKGSSV